jgi:hypothetical protein
LEGTPAGELGSEDFPVGSEEYRQRHYPGSLDENAHRRVYAGRIKTLIAHRLEAAWGRFQAGISEIQIVGGKVPDLQDANPFAIFHNEFNHGYNNLSVSLDGQVRLPSGFGLFCELNMDDVVFGQTESQHTSASILGLMAGARHTLSMPWGCLKQGLTAVRTDPFLYGYLQPYNTQIARHILATNYRREGDSSVVDRYVLDYPLGYARGSDALDFWYLAGLSVGGNWDLGLTIGVLAKGLVDSHTPYERYYDQAGAEAPTGIAEHELRAAARVTFRWRPGLALDAGLASQRYWNESHIAGREVLRGEASLGLSASFPR